MRNIRRIIWGVVLVVAAAVIALNSFDIINFDLFFDGWWTLFIIIPSLAGLFEKGKRIESLVGLGFGVLFLLWAQDVIDLDIIWKIGFPLAIAVVGIKMIISSFRKEKTHKIHEQMKADGRDAQKGAAIFSGTEMDFSNVVFDGADLTAIFGGVECDLRNAIIDRDAVVKVNVVFGGIDIKVPDHVKIVTNTTSIFGGVDVNKNDNNAVHTIYIEGACIFGGIDIK